MDEIDPFKIISVAFLLAAGSLIFAGIVRWMAQDSVVMTFFILFFVFLFMDPIAAKIKSKLPLT